MVKLFPGCQNRAQPTSDLTRELANRIRTHWPIGSNCPRQVPTPLAVRDAQSPGSAVGPQGVWPSVGGSDPPHPRPGSLAAQGKGCAGPESLLRPAGSSGFPLLAACPKESECRPPLSFRPLPLLSRHARGVPLTLASLPLLLLGPAAFLACRACGCAPSLPSPWAFPWAPLRCAARRFSGGGAVSVGSFFPAPAPRRCAARRFSRGGAVSAGSFFPVTVSTGRMRGPRGPHPARGP